MNDEQIKQRIKYLVEHGGVFDDPLSDIRRNIRVLYAMISLALVFHVVEFIAGIR